ncbi:CHAD domain-containing protein [Pengzhenrongella phosphoraccumulans]|uniref:CHAD domain-containing protein n=1 Tax=Pengzhenrongella phosphoraccumulans TaxID=3114394 RepID=UPI0038907745
MTSPTRVFQGADAGRLDLGAVADELAGRYTIARGPVRRVRCRRLDTADRRMGAAGLTLDDQTAPRSRRLVLGRADGSQAVAVVGDLRWPALAEALPAGPLADEVVPVLGIRALTVVADDLRSWQRWDLQDGEGKTVARVDVDEPIGDDGRPVVLTIQALRGYDDDARRVARLLLRGGLRPVEPAAPDQVADVQPVQAGPDRPAVVVLTDALIAFEAAMRANLPGVLADVDTEFLHEFRVALRRTRTTLRLGRSVVPARWRSDWEPEFAWVGALTTPVRDLDVYVLGLPTMAGWLVAADPADLRPFALHLARRRSAARATMVRGLRSARFRRLQTGWDMALAELAAESVDGRPGGAAGEDGGEAGNDVISAGVLAGRQLDRAHRRVVRDGTSISAASPADDLHRLRGRCKALRYALEVFEPVAEPRTGRKAIADLKGLQDVLGRFQDAEVQHRALREFADEMMLEGVPAAALLALGELITHLDAEQARARREFDRAFTDFVQTSGTTAARLHRLGGGT